ncbi:hypothetical protein Hanom_Chr08g00695131 [Helianthus anomalus]
MHVNNSNQVGSSNANKTRTLVVQAGESCDWSVQVGSGGQSGTTCYAKVIKHIKHVLYGDSSEDEESPKYSGSSDEEV